ncbi:MAG: pilin [Candidatus Daviesbacteria bacterium]|nr:pilin [Candidatus Daviesbacteria bacterium]
MTPPLPPANAPGIAEIHNLVNKFIDLSVPFAFVALVIMFIVGGIKYMMSAGDPKNTQTARSTITYAVLGVTLLAVVWLVLKLIEAFTGVSDLTKFCLGFKPFCT